MQSEKKNKQCNVMYVNPGGMIPMTTDSLHKATEAS